MKKNVLLLSIFTLLLWQVNAQAQIITTVAGGGTTGLGDGGMATDCTFYAPTSVVKDATGNLYITDRQNHRIRKINTAGIITTIAGTGIAGFGGDGADATLATLNEPYGIALDIAGNVYFCDGKNSRVRKIDIAGIITTIAGTGGIMSDGDGGSATDAQIGWPGCVATDNIGNIYITVGHAHIVRKISSSGIITTIAGFTNTPGYTGNGGPATNARLNTPHGITVDGTGNIYITEYGNNCVRKIDGAGIITTIAGSETGAIGYTGDGGPATGAKLRGPVGIDINASGYIYICDGFNHCIREINPSGIINTVAGTGVNGFSGDGSAATAAKLFGPTGVAVDAANNIYIADWGNNRIRTLKVPTSVYDARKTTYALSVYPNPSSGQFAVTIEANVIEPIHLVVCDVFGKKVMEITDKTNEPIAIKFNIPTGVYILSANVNGTPISQKISVIR
jgi:hypothetical protein